MNLVLDDVEELLRGKFAWSCRLGENPLLALALARERH